MTAVGLHRHKSCKLFSF